MNKLPRILVKNLVVAAMIGLTAFASWAVTEDFQAPAVNLTIAHSAQY